MVFSLLNIMSDFFKRWKIRWISSIIKNDEINENTLIKINTKFENEFENALSKINNDIKHILEKKTKKLIDYLQHPNNRKCLRYSQEPKIIDLINKDISFTINLNLVKSQKDECYPFNEFAIKQKIMILINLCLH